MKLNEFVDRLYGIGDIESPKTIRSKRTLNESCCVKDEDDLDESYRNDDFRDLCREYSSLYPYDISLREVWDEIVRNYEDEDLANDVVEYLEGAFGDEEEYDDEFFESLNEARNPENDEVNAVLRKWANSDRNRLSKRDQKILDDAGVKLEPYFPGEKEKIVVSSESERRPSGVYERGWGKESIRRMHPDHDIANDVKTDRELHISNPYNINKNRWDYDDHQLNRETSAEARALRPYSDEYRRRKDSLEYARKHNWHKEEAEKALNDFRADMQAKKNESVTLNESKEGLKDWFWSMIEDNELDTETATGILLTYISDEDLLDAVEETKEYLES